MNRTITVTDIEPAPLSLRHPLGVNLDLRVTMKRQNGTAVDPTLAQFVMMPRSLGGIYATDMEAFDVPGGIARVEISGSALTDSWGYNIELYARTANDVPGDPALPTSLAASGVLRTQGSAYRTMGPLMAINVPVVVGPPGEPGVVGAPGPAGEPGSEGQRGSMWFTGLGDPTMTGDFVIGDMYLDSGSGNVWRWEGPGAWVHQ